MPKTQQEIDQVETTITVRSSAIRQGERIPREFSCQGSNTSPPLQFVNLPEDAVALALVMDDPDAPKGTFTHWTFWNLPPSITALEQAADLNVLGAMEGENDFGDVGYGGPCPPGGEEHRYFVKVYALSEELALDRGAKPDQVYEAMEGRVIARGELMGTYSKT